MQTNNFYLHFAADLKRVIFCLMNGNPSGAKTFLEHANVIYLKHLKDNEYAKDLELDFDTAWFKIYNTDIPSDQTKIKLYSDELLTFTSVIFIRVLHKQPIGNIRLDGQMKPTMGDKEKLADVVPTVQHIGYQSKK